MKKSLSVFVNLGLIALTILAVVKCCLVSFDIDEAYAIAQSYRFAVGDHMFSEMWEPHQMSSFGATLFIVPFLWLTGGDTTGIVLYLRIVGTLLHLLIGTWLYFVAKKRLGRSCAVLIALAHVNFLPKWITMPEFEIMQYWSVCVLFLCLLGWEDKNACTQKLQTPSRIRREDAYLLIGGVAMFVTLLTYPTMLLLYPVYVLALCKLNVGTGKEKWRGILLFTFPALVLGIWYLLYLGSYMSVSEFLKNVGYVFMDSSHSVELGERMLAYGQELLSFCGVLLLPLAIATILVFIGKKMHMCSEASRKSYIILGMLFVTLILVIMHIWGSIFGEQNQFYLYFRYLWIVIMGLITYGMYRGQNAVYLYAGMLPGLIGVLASVLVTNMSLEIAIARVYVGVLATIFIIKGAIINKFSEEKILKRIAYVTLVMFIGGLLVSKLVLVRFTGCIPATIRAPFAQVTDGPAKGLWIREDLAGQFNENHEVIEAYTQPGDKLLYFGCENLYYLSARDITMATPSVQGTAVFNEMYLLYYEEHPDRIPNVVIVDKVFKMNPYYRYSEENKVIEDWIAEEFADAEVVETNHFTILRK